MLRILDVGCGKESVAQLVFQADDKKITRLDAFEENKPDVLHDITKPLPEELKGSYDIVYASHVLEHIDRESVHITIKNLVDALAPMGELWITVPSLEWAARELLANHDGVHVQLMIFGGQNNHLDYHRCGFTLRSLRKMMELNDLIVRKAYQAPFQISYGDKFFDCVQNIVIGLKYQE